MTEHAKDRRHLLLLAGSGEARAIAAALADRKDLRVTASILYPPRSFGPLPVPTRTGRFGGESGLRRFLAEEGVTAVLGATHPFAARMPCRAARVCAAAGVPFAQVLRPPWQPGPGDNWTEVADEATVAALLEPGARVFTTTGRPTLTGLVSGSDARFFARRMVECRGGDEFKNVEYVYGKGPFSVDDEVSVLTRLKITVLVVKNSGGEPSRTKLEAARRLGLPVILIARPQQPDCTRLETVEQALEWVDRH